MPLEPRTSTPQSSVSSPSGPSARPVDDGAIHVSAVVLRRADGRVLQARKRGTRFLMFPGGKPEPGETYLAGAVRELAEETGLVVAPAALRSLGLREAPAANEAGRDLVAAVYVVAAGSGADGVAPHEEIEELAWVDPTLIEDDGTVAEGLLAPLSADVLRELP